MGVFKIPLGSAGELIELHQEFGGLGASWFAYEGARVRGPIEHGVQITAKDGNTYSVRLSQQLGDIYPKVFVNDKEVPYVERPARWMTILAASLFVPVFFSAINWWDKGFVPVFAALGAYLGCQFVMRRIKNQAFAALGVVVLTGIGWLLALIW